MNKKYLTSALSRNSTRCLIKKYVLFLKYNLTIILISTHKNIAKRTFLQFKFRSVSDVMSCNNNV